MGAWIETLVTRPGFQFVSVAPFMGAWIETFKFKGCITFGQYPLLPLWEHGLKHLTQITPLLP